jgi:hypothetical protein
LSSSAARVGGAIDQNIARSVGTSQSIGYVEVALRVDGESAWIVQSAGGGKAGRCENGQAQQGGGEAVLLKLHAVSVIGFELIPIELVTDFSAYF